MAHQAFNVADSYLVPEGEMPEPSQELLDGSTSSLDDAGNEAAGVSNLFSIAFTRLHQLTLTDPGRRARL